MRYQFTIPLLFALLAPAVASALSINCAKTSLAAVVNAAQTKSIVFTGVCSGPITIRTDGLKLTGVGTAVIDGGGKDAVTVEGAHGVALTNFEIKNGKNGLLGSNGAHLTLTGVNVHDNPAFGITLQTGSSAVLSGITTSGNLFGLDLETGSAATVTGSFAATSNFVFGVNVNGSSITFASAVADISGNAVGMQIGTAANTFINDSITTLNVTNNHATGLTVVSGSHMVSFGGTINATGNLGTGVSVNSKAGLDLDAGSVLTCSNNKAGGLLLQEGSVMTVFNNPRFSGIPGFSTVQCEGNANDGVTVRSGSTLTLSNQAKLISSANGDHGLSADNGSSVTLVNATVTGNMTKDIALTFGSRADIQTTTTATIACDATALVRGTSGIVCPQ